MDPPSELNQLAEDWITLWQSELAAMAADPELAEGWAAAVALGAAWWRAQAAGFGRAAMPFPGAADVAPRPPAAPWPAPAGPAPDGQRDASHGQPDTALIQRLAELERRLAEIEGGAGGGGTDRPGPRRNRRRT